MSPASVGSAERSGSDPVETRASHRPVVGAQTLIPWLSVTDARIWKRQPHGRVAGYTNERFFACEDRFDALEKADFDLWLSGPKKWRVTVTHSWTVDLPDAPREELEEIAANNYQLGDHDWEWQVEPIGAISPHEFEGDDIDCSLCHEGHQHYLHADRVEEPA